MTDFASTSALCSVADTPGFDYKIWDPMQQVMYKTLLDGDIRLLKQRLIDTWLNTSQGIVDDAIDQ